MLFSRIGRASLFSLALLAPLALSACTGFRPVYSDSAVSQKVELIYADPTNHYEQVLYQDLALRLGEAQPGSGAPKLYVSIKAKQNSLASIKSAYRSRRMTVTGRVRLIAADGTSLLNISRSESADFTSTQQILATDQAADDAAVRATHALADQIRLSVLGVLAK